MELIMSTFKVGDKVRRIGGNCAGTVTGGSYTVKGFRMGGRALMLLEFPEDELDWEANNFELVRDHVLTPEEVFKHLQEGTKLEFRQKGIGSTWSGVTNAWCVQLREICNYEWRIKPVPEIIEANGRKYKLIEE